MEFSLINCKDAKRPAAIVFLSSTVVDSMNSFTFAGTSPMRGFIHNTVSSVGSLFTFRDHCARRSDFKVFQLVQKKCLSLM